MSWISVALGFLAIAAWLSTYLLTRAAWTKPRIGALTERAVLAVLLSAFSTVCVGLVWNTEAGQGWIPVELSRILFRVCLVVIIVIPVYWLALYASNRLGGGQ